MSAPGEVEWKTTDSSPNPLKMGSTGYLSFGFMDSRAREVGCFIFIDQSGGVFVGKIQSARGMAPFGATNTKYYKYFTIEEAKADLSTKAKASMMRAVRSNR